MTSIDDVAEGQDDENRSRETLSSMSFNQQSMPSSFRPNYRATVDVAKKNEEHHRRLLAVFVLFLFGIWLIAGAGTWMLSGSVLMTLIVMFFLGMVPVIFFGVIQGRIP